MKQTYSTLRNFIVALLCLAGISANAQLTGTKNIPGDYATLTLAITDLNTQGVGAGGVTFAVAAGYTETISTRLNVTATGTSADRIVFQKSGVGSNPLVTAYTGTTTPGSATPDGIWSLQGSDYVTIDGIDLFDPNAANPATMEYGYGLFKNGTADGAQFDSIRNCVITLSRVNNATGSSPMVDGSVGILVINSTPTTATTAITPTAATGTNSSNTFCTNTVQNCNYGIVLNGYAAPTPFTLGDTGNDIGGASASTGNMILNYGGGAATNPAAGIRVNNQWSVNISNNTINNNNGSGVNHATTLRGIFAQAGASANATISNNTITLNSGATTSILTAIDNGIGSTASSNTINITGNTIQNCTYTTSTTGVFIAISNSSTAATVNITGNNILNNVVAGTGTNPLIETGSPTTANASNNIITGNNRTSTSGTLYCIKTTSPTNFTANNNTIDGNSFITAGATGTVVGIYSFSSAANCTENNNIIRNISVNGTGTIYGMREFGITGIKNFQNNQIYNLTSSGATPIVGIRESTGTSVTISGNQIYTFSSVGGAGVNLSGIEIAGGTTDICSQNKIYDLSTTATAPTLNGILVSSGTTVTLSNNLIGDLRTPAANAANPLVGINATGSTTLNVWYNTVYLNASSSGVAFGSSAISSSTSPTLDLRNNLFVNLSAPNGTGLTVAYRRSSATLTSFAAASNNNSYYAGSPSASNLIFYDGTNSDQTLSAYQTRVATRDNAAVSVNPVFSSTSGASPVFLHIPSATASLLESGGTTVGSVTTDYDNDSRPGPVGSVNGGALAPDIGADEFDGALLTCVGTPTAGTATITPPFQCGSGTFGLGLSGADSGPGITYQWQSSPVSGGPYTNIGGATTAAYTTATMSSTTYFVCVVTCTSSGLSSTSTEVTGTVFPSASITVTPTTGMICAPGGSPVTLTANGGVSYSWTPTTGLTPTTGSPVSANPASTTTYTVTGTDGNGCTGTATATITINEVPTISAVTATPSTICSGGNSQLNINAGTVSTYIQSNPAFAADPCQSTAGPTGDDAVQGPDNIGFSFNYFGNNYTQFGISTNGNIQLGDGSGTANNPSYSTAFTDVAIPNGGVPNNMIALGWDDWLISAGQITYGVTGSAPNRKLVICYNTTGRGSGNADTLIGQIVLEETTNNIYLNVTKKGISSNTCTQGIENASGIIGYPVAGRNNQAWSTNNNTTLFAPPTLTYSWNPSTFLSSSTVSNPMANNVTTSTSYTVTATNAGCSSTGSVTITAGTALSATTSVTPGNTVCEGTNITLNTVPAGGGAPYTFAWTGPNGFNSTLQNPVINNIQVANAGTYSCVVTDNCTSTFTVNITMVVNPAPSVSVNPSSATYCNPGTPVSIIASGSATTYSWSPAAGLSATSGTNVDASPVSSTTYTVTGTDGIGCTAAATVAITSSETPSMSSVTSTPAAICSGSSAQLNALAGTTTAYTLTTPAYTLQPCQSTAGPTGDDVVQGPDNIGFSFNYFGNTYTQFGISTNGNIQLGNGSGSANNPSYSNAWTDVAIPNAATPNNLIALAWDDWFISAGQITYGVTGSAPNRKLIICYNTTGRGSGNADTLNGQIVLEESTNNVILNITKKGVSTNTCTQGIENATGTVGYGVPARQNQAWSSNNNSQMFSPSGGSPVFTWTPSTFLSSTTISNPMANNATSTTTYSVSATVGGCSSSGSVTLTVNPTPTITATAGNSTICSGSSTTLSGNGGTTYNWMPGSLSGTTVSVSPTSTTTYTVTGTDGNGCNNTATVTVAVNPSPTVTATASASTVCAGTSVTLNGNGATSYSWSGGVTDGISFVPSSTTTYTVTGTDGNGCTGTDMITVTVNPLPTVTANATSTAVCTGNSVTLTGGGATSYTWSGSVTDGVAFTPAVTDTYTVTGTDANTCVNTATVTVTVNALPTVVANTTASTICDGNNITLTGSGATSYNWSGGVLDGISFSPSGTTTYTVTGTDGNGCTDTDMITITVNPNPTVTATASATTVCSGTSITLNGTGATSYSWSGGVTDGIAFVPSASTTYTVTGTDGNGCTGADVIVITVNPLPVVNLGPDVAQCSGTVLLDAGNAGSNFMWNDNSTSQTLTASSSGIYWVDVTDGNSCASRDSVTITINSNPTVNLGPDVTACGSATLDAGNPGATYAWSTTETTQMITVTTSGTYSVVATLTGGCNASDVVNVTINPLPTVTISFPNDTVCLNGGLFTLTGESPAGGTWSGNGVSGNTFDPLVTGLGYTPVDYMFTDVNGCSATANDSLWVDICNGIANNDPTLMTINAYPNPNAGIFTIEVNNPNADEMRIDIMDVEGRLIYSEQLIGVKNGYTKQIDLSNIANGAYFMRVNAKNDVKTIKLFKQG